VRPSVMLMTIHTYMKPVASGYILTDHWQKSMVQTSVSQPFLLK
jgi:hypothetical protein